MSTKTVSREEWRIVPGFDGWYEVTSRGRIRSWRLTARREVRRRKPRVLRGRYTDRGYHFIKMTHPVFGAMDVGVHQVVLAAFVGARPERMVCDHINAEPSDNRVENLRWVTTVENHHHAVALGRITVRMGPRSFSPLDEAKVRAMRERRRHGASLKALTEEFKVSSATVSKIVNHLIWREVQQ